MSRYLCDTSCLVAAVCAWHEHHARTRAEVELRAARGDELVLAAHSLAETYSVLTRLPSPHRLKAKDAISLLEANWAQIQVVHLTGKETWQVLRQAEERGIIGGQTYDALIAFAAIKTGARTLVTWNQRNFAAFQDKIEVLTPS